MRFIHWAHRVSATRTLGAGFCVVNKGFPGLWAVPAVQDPRLGNGARGFSSQPETLWTSRAWGVEVEAAEEDCTLFRSGTPAAIPSARWRDWCADDDNGVVIRVGAGYQVVRLWRATWQPWGLEVTEAEFPVVRTGAVRPPYMEFSTATEAVETLDRTHPDRLVGVEVFLNFEEDRELVQELYGI